MDTNRIREYIESVRWVFAKTMPTNPHEYTVLSWNNKQHGEFKWFVQEIRTYGYSKKFNRVYYKYLDIDGKMYWTMGADIGATIIINRANIDT